MFRLMLPLQKRKCTTGHKKEYGAKKPLNEVSAPIYLSDVSAFIVFKCRGYFHLLRCLMNSLRDCDLSFKQGKKKKFFFIMEADKMDRDKKSSFCSDLSGLKTYFNACKYVLKPLRKATVYILFTFFKRHFDFNITCILFLSGIEKCCCFYLDNVCYFCPLLHVIY